MPMTSRERVAAALEFRETDRVPIDLSGHRSSGIAAMVYPKLRDYLGLTPRPVKVYDMIQQLAVVDEDVLDFFGIDTIEMGRGFLTDDAEWKDWVLPDGTPCLVPGYVNLEKRGEDWFVLAENGTALGVQKKGCLYFEQTHFPLMERGIAKDDFCDLEEVLPYSTWTGVPHPGAHLPLNESGLKEMAFQARLLRESTDRAVIGLFGGNMFEIPQFLYRIDNYLLALHLYPHDVERLSRRLCDIHLKNLEKWLGAVGPFIDVIQFGDDLGGQQGPLISPEDYRRFIKPYHKALWTRAKELSDAKVMLHCCGGVRELLDDLIDAGLDAINPVQFNCRGMDTAELKKEFGNRLAFWGGGCDTQEILPQADPETVAEHVRAQVKILRTGGGFVFQQVHNILANVPPANITGMLEAVNGSVEK